jgi:hypothetical protein
LSTIEATFAMLRFPKQIVQLIYNSGCCGMAGRIFWLRKNIAKSIMQMGEDTLFQKIRSAASAEIAAGTSYRHQIFLMEPMKSFASSYYFARMKPVGCGRFSTK